MPYKKIITKLQYIFIAIAALFIIKLINDSHAELWFIITESKPIYLLSAIFFGILNHLFIPFCTKTVLNSYDVNLSYFFILKTYITRLPNRYLPGGIWHSVSRAFDFHHKGVKKPELSSLFLLESLLPVSLSFIIGGSGLIILSPITVNFTYILALSIMLGFIILILSPKLINTFILTAHNKINIRKFLYCVISYILMWLILSFIFIAYFLIFKHTLTEVSLLEIGFTYLFSWGVGFVAIFAPQGIGVFEITASHILGDKAILYNMAVILVGFRIIVLFNDLLIWLLFKIYMYFKSS